MSESHTHGTSADNLAQRLQDKLRRALPEADITVEDPFNDGTHLTARVLSPAFTSLTRVQQHRVVYAALGNAFEDELHALQLTTGPKSNTLKN